jgi:adenylate kinase
LSERSFIVSIAVGVPGVGKSTVLSITKKLLQEKSLYAEVVNYGDFIFEELKDSGLISSRDDLRRLPLKIQFKHQSNAAKRIIDYATKIFEEKKQGVLFIDTHLWIKTRSGLWPGLPLHVVQILRPDLLILVEADPMDIINRIRRDQSRYREDYADPRFIEELQEMNRREALVIATLSGAAIKIVLNKEGRAEDAARDIVDAVMALIR